MNLSHKKLFLIALSSFFSMYQLSLLAHQKNILLIPQTSVDTEDSVVSKAETATSKAEIKADAQITKKRPLVTSEVDEDEVEIPKKKVKKAPKKKRLVTTQADDEVEDEAEEVETKKVEKKAKKKPLVSKGVGDDEETETVVVQKKTVKNKKRPLISTKSEDADEEEEEQPVKATKKEESTNEENQEKKSESSEKKLKITQDWDKKTLGYKHWTGWYYPSKWILSFNGKEVLSFEGKEFDVRAKTITVDPTKTLKARIDWEFLGGRRKGWKEVDYKINENTDTLKLSFDWKNEPYQLTIANTKPIATRSSDNKTD